MLLNWVEHNMLGAEAENIPKLLTSELAGVKCLGVNSIFAQKETFLSNHKL